MRRCTPSVLLLSPSIAAILSHPKKRGEEEVQFTQNAPSVHKQDTPVLPAHPLLFKSFFNFTARWYNKNSCAAFPEHIPPCPRTAAGQGSSSSPSPHGTLSLPRALGAGCQAGQPQKYTTNVLRTLLFPQGTGINRIHTSPALCRHVPQSTFCTNTCPACSWSVTGVSIPHSKLSLCLRCPFLWGFPHDFHHTGWRQMVEAAAEWP